jgi:Fe-S-cluster-containing hydrogenase component 2
LKPIPEYLRTGIIGLEDLAPLQMIPPQTRLNAKRPVAMIECIQEIPCNSCAMACKMDAIRMETVTDIPRVDFDKCTGCMACVMVCPGQAIFLLRAENGRGYVTLPYELLPVPKAGDVGRTFDREGKILGKSKAVRVLPPERNSGTALVTIDVPKEWLLEARSVRFGEV